MPDPRKRRRLTDLYVQGEVLTLDDTKEDPIAVWIQKITPLEQREAVTKAGAARARIMLLQFKDFDNDDRLALLSQAQFQGLAKDREQMIEFLCGAELSRMRLSHESEIGELEEWSDHEYLESLQQAWADDLFEKYALDPEDKEAANCFAELKRFDDQVTKMLDSDRRAFKRDYATMSDEQIVNKVVDLLIEAEADDLWISEYRRWNIYYSTRETENHAERYFETRKEIDQLQPVILGQLINAIDNLDVERTEGKD